MHCRMLAASLPLPRVSPTEGCSMFVSLFQRSGRQGRRLRVRRGLETEECPSLENRERKREQSRGESRREQHGSLTEDGTRNLEWPQHAQNGESLPHVGGSGRIGLEAGCMNVTRAPKGTGTQGCHRWAAVSKATEVSSGAEYPRVN